MIVEIVIFNAYLVVERWVSSVGGAAPAEAGVHVLVV